MNGSSYVQVQIMNEHNMLRWQVFNLSKESLIYKGNLNPKCSSHLTHFLGLVITNTTHSFSISIIGVHWFTSMLFLETTTGNKKQYASVGNHRTFNSLNAPYTFSQPLNLCFILITKQSMKFYFRIEKLEKTPRIHIQTMSIMV